MDSIITCFPSFLKAVKTLDEQASMSAAYQAAQWVYGMGKLNGCPVLMPIGAGASNLLKNAITCLSHHAYMPLLSPGMNGRSRGTLGGS
jgi:hypothetical protein